MNALAAITIGPSVRALPCDNHIVAIPGLWRQGLLASSAILVDEDQLAEMKRAVAVLDDHLRRAAPTGVDPGILGFDFHPTADGPRLIEVNTNPGGLLLVLAHQRACAGLWPHAPAQDMGPDQVEMAAAKAFAGSAAKVAIVDDDPADQFLYPEFLLYRRLFARLGLGGDVIDARHWHGGCDGVYNRLTDFDLSDPSHAALAQDRASGQVTMIPDMSAHAAYADKRHLVTLSRQRACAAWVPPTRMGDEDWPSTWAERRHLFFKPVLGHGGKGGYRGDKISRATWEGLDPARMVVQELVPPPVVESGFKVDIRAYAVGGRVLAFGARLYRGQMTNFRSDGGGLASVFRPHAG
ncbi:MAG: hypothetical protein FD176_3421 [Rhodospirillaceae bacterium]|nr:MAG: hypothetical protein FD176_3421 [Rhodospirillaceae bacterium]TNC94220.1 MAG: Uncharacterized protein FD119_3389 [Stygiobacter sp.]